MRETIGFFRWFTTLPTFTPQAPFLSLKAFHYQPLLTKRVAFKRSSRTTSEASNPLVIYPHQSLQKCSHSPHTCREVGFTWKLSYRLDELSQKLTPWISLKMIDLCESL